MDVVRIIAWIGAWIGVAALATLGIAGLTYAPDLAIPDGVAGRAVEVAGISLRVQSEGSGRDVLMIHGCPGALEDFDRPARALASSFRVTRYDRPGHGYSGEPEAYSLAHQAQVALALIERLALERVIVVGHSYGGSTALALGLLGSPRVAAIVLVDSAVYESVRPIPLLYRIASLPALGLGLARAIPNATLEGMVERAVTAEFAAGPPPPGFVALRSRLFSQPKVIHALAREYTETPPELARQATRYAEIDVPIYFAVQRDHAARRAGAERLVRERPATRVEPVGETGHYIQVERPDAVTTLVQRAAQESDEMTPKAPGVGDLAPDFELEASDGRTYRLSDFRGKQAVALAWFPMAFTSGCTIECKSLAQDGDLIEAYDVTYFMASVDPVSGEKGNAAFAKAHAARFPILSDPTKRTAAAYGVLSERGHANRWTFYIDENGRIAAIDKEVARRLATSAQDMAKKLGELGVATRNANGP